MRQVYKVLSVDPEIRVNRKTRKEWDRSKCEIRETVLEETRWVCGRATSGERFGDEIVTVEFSCAPGTIEPGDLISGETDRTLVQLSVTSTCFRPSENAYELSEEADKLYSREISRITYCAHRKT